MSERRALTLRGYDVVIEGRRPDGRGFVNFLDRQGRRGDGFTLAWPHELRGAGWGIAAIKAAIAASPLVTFSSDSPERADGAGRPLLFAHHAAAHRQEDQ